MKKRITVISLIVAIVLCSGMSSNVAEAASKKAKAKKAYASFLAKRSAPKIDDSDFNDAGFALDNKDYVSCFSLYDIDKDKTPELITCTNVNFRWSIVRIYTYKNSKVTPYKFSDGEDAVFDDRATANGAYSFYICTEGDVHNDYRGDYGQEYKTYKCLGKKLKLSSMNETGHKIKNIKSYSNTKKNRNKLKNNKI